MHVELGDNTKYAFMGARIASFQLKSGKPLNMSDVLYVLGPKKNLLSISSMEDKWYAMEFIDGRVLSCPKG
jgi:hypothetical protein